MCWSRMVILSCALCISPVAASAKPKTAPAPVLCPDTTLRGLGADAASSLRVHDFRVYESSSFWGGRSIPGIACSKADKDKLVVRGGAYYSDALSTCRSIPAYLKQVSDEIIRYNQSISRSLAFQVATGCRAE
jgi:hypothetical protein